VAKTPGSNDIVYEVLYVDMIDPMDDAKDQIVSEFTIQNTQTVKINQANLEQKDNSNYDSTQAGNPADPFALRPNQAVIKVDSNAISVSNNSSNKRYISSTSNMRKNLAAVGETENEFLPLWMRTPQTSSTQPLGYVKAVPICYCQPGTSAAILAALKNSDFDFKNIDFEIDRYVIDSTTESGTEQYVLFSNYQYNI